MLLVIGGQARKVGKTSLAEGIISRFRECQWTAVKVSPAEAGFALEEEAEPGSGDSGRYLRAGARRAFHLRARPGELEAALPALREVLAAAPHAIVESDSIVEYLRPDLYLVVLDFACREFKTSTLRHLERADAFVVIARGLPAPSSPGIPPKLRFPVQPPDYVTEDLASLVCERLSARA